MNFFCRKLKVIVYNKTRKYAGHTIEIVLSSRDTISTVKEKILEKTSIPVDIQHIVFGGSLFYHRFPIVMHRYHFFIN